jgi:uncharacterized repeat protein (TIGR03803 family)
MRDYKFSSTAKLARVIALVVALAAVVVGVAGKSQAQTETVIYSFPGGTVGTTPYAGLIFDAAGNLYSTAYLGGAKRYGSVFELTPGTGGWQGSFLHAFRDRTDGGNPTSNLLFDGSGNLYGTTNYGGGVNGTGCVPIGCGVVFELSPAGGGVWHETILHTFFKSANDGADPNNDLIMDAAGNLYGTTGAGGAKGQGIAFKLSPAGGGWDETILHAFGYGRDGLAPFGGMILDAGGNLYGTTAYGGNPNTCVPKNQGGCGVVYELSPISGGGWREQVLHVFNGPDGAAPVASLIWDGAGNLYGTALFGGDLKNCNNGGGLSGCGVVFELSPKSGGGWQETVLHTFTGGADGAGPVASLILDASGNLYGTASRGGNLSASQCVPYGCGLAFKLSPNSGGGWHETVLHTFSGTPDGAVPGGNLIFDASGNIYGTTSIGGPNGNGTVFEITP